MKRITIFLAIMLFPIGAKSQDLQLQDCVRESLKNNPLSANKALAVQIAEVKGKILKSAWLPGIDINAQSTWQSDVVTLEFDLPFAVDFPKIPKDQYKVTTDISQLIYDGGSIRQQQVLEKLTSELSVKELEKGEFDLKSSVEDLYFAILVAEKRIEVLNLMTETLQSTVKQIESGVRNGLLSESDLPVVIAEQIKTDQQLISLKGLKQRAVHTLSILMGREIPLDTRFLTPVATKGLLLNGERPEYGMFELQGEMLTTRKTLLNTQLRPKVFAFGQAGYGKPGLNFMGDAWEPYMLLGVKGTWNVWDWGKVRRQKETLNLNERVINNQEESFTKQLTQIQQKQEMAISEINALLLKDEELLVNRTKVTEAYRSRLNNGLITASQFLNEWTREQDARISHEVRKIELISAEYKLLSIMGKNYNYEIN